MEKPILFRLIDKAIYDYKMILPDEKILIAASGGKDSTALVEYMAQRSKRPHEKFSFSAVHIASDFGGRLPETILKLMQSWDVEPLEIEVNVASRLKEGRKMSCYWCSTQRRSELLRVAAEKGFTSIMLGHHMDDVLETLIMNALGKGEFSTMPAVLQYIKYPVKIIRPLYYVREKLIIEHAKRNGYLGFTCTCSLQLNSERKNARKILDKLCGEDEKKKEKLFWSLKNMKKEYLP